MIYDLKSKKILRCLNDGLFLTEQKNKKETEIYDKDYYSINPHPQNSNEKYFENKLAKILTRTPEVNGHNEILDVGCGWGNFLEVLKKHKISYKGIDSSDESINICRSKNLNVEKILLQDLIKKEGNKYSAITFFQVIEHIKNPIPFLEAAKKLLKKNRVILITTPSNDSPLRKIFGSKWSVYNDPTHYVFYNKKTLLQLLVKAGFKKSQVNNDQIRFLSSNYFIKRFLKIAFNWKLEIGNWKFSFPIPTDPFGDLEAIAST